MAVLAALNVKSLFDKYDLSGDSNKAMLDIKAELLDATTFGATTRTKTAGLRHILADLESFLQGTGKQAAALQTTGAAQSNLVFTAVTPGTAGNSITVVYVVAGLNTALSIGVVGTAITVNVATNGAGTATSTGAQVLAALNGNAPAAALITTSLASGNDGTGVVAAFAVQSLFGGVDGVDVEGFNAIGTSDLPFTLSPDGVEGNLAYFFRATSAELKHEHAIGALLKMIQHFENSKTSSPLVRGTVFGNRTLAVPALSLPAAGGVNLGAVASGKSLWMAVHLFALSGANGTSVQFAVQTDPTGGGAWAGSPGLTTGAMTTPGSYFGSVAGPLTDAWQRIAFTGPGGSAQKASFIAVLGIA